VKPGDCARTSIGFDGFALVRADWFRGVLYWEHTGRAASDDSLPVLELLNPAFRDAVALDCPEDEARALFASFAAFPCEDGLGDRFNAWSVDNLPAKYR
jgi:hypothetical protein